MPANPKYLSNSWQRAIKLFTAIIGGYFITVVLHFVLGKLLTDKTPIVAMTIWTAWIIWVVFMIIAFGARRPLRMLFYYFLVIVILGGVIYFVK